MLITLTGGDFGGQEISWAPHANLDDHGREVIEIEGLIYAKVSEDQAVFSGYASTEI